MLINHKLKNESKLVGALRLCSWIYVSFVVHCILKLLSCKFIIYTVATIRFHLYTKLTKIKIRKVFSFVCVDVAVTADADTTFLLSFLLISFCLSLCFVLLSFHFFFHIVLHNTKFIANLKADFMHLYSLIRKMSVFICIMYIFHSGL